MQNLVRNKTIGVTGNGGRGTAGPVLVGTFFTIHPCSLFTGKKRKSLLVFVLP